MDSAAVAAIGAGAALLSSALTGTVSYVATRKTLQHDARQLASRLASERGAAREDRQQESRKEAYVSLLEYIFWLSDTNAISRRIVARQYDAVSALRPGGRLPKTEKEAESERAAFLSAGPTTQERKRLAAGPTSKENASIWALVTGLSSEKVLSAFEDLMKRDHSFSSEQRRLQISFLRLPEPAKGAEGSKVDDAANKQIEVAKSTFEAIVSARAAHEEFEKAFETIKALVRDELDHPRTA